MTKQNEAEAPYDWSQEQGADKPMGMEDVSQADLGIPFLSIVQIKSAEVDPSHRKHEAKKIEGAKTGTIFNTNSREILHQPGGDPFRFVPCATKKQNVEWLPRKVGGGLAEIHYNDGVLALCQKDDKGKLIRKDNGNVIEPTWNFFGLYTLAEGDKAQIAVIAMKASQLKYARKWFNMATAIRLGEGLAPLWSHFYLMSSFHDSNPQGETFESWGVAMGDWVKEPKLVAQAKETHADAIAAQGKLLSAPAQQEEVPY